MAASAQADKWSAAKQFLRGAIDPIPADELSLLMAEHRRCDKNHRRIRCLEIEDQVLRSYLRMIVGIVNTHWLSFPECYEEALQEGATAAVKAIREWRGERGASVATYMTQSVKFRIINFRRDVVMKHVTISDSTHSGPSVISKRTVRYCESLDALREGTDYPMINLSDATAARPELHAIIQDVDEVIDNGFPKREARVLRMYFYDGKTHQEIADKLKMTRARAHQICGRAIQRLRRKFHVGPQSRLLQACIPMSGGRFRHISTAS